MFVVRRKLEMPCQLPGARMQRNDTIGKQVVAGTRVTEEIWAGIADAPEKQVKRRVITAGDPGWAATCSPCVIFPGLVTKFTRARNRIELPQSLTCRDVEGRQKSANPEFATSHPHDDGTVYNKWRASQRVAIG